VIPADYPCWLTSVPQLHVLFTGSWQRCAPPEAGSSRRPVAARPAGRISHHFRYI